MWPTSWLNLPTLLDQTCGSWRDPQTLDRPTRPGSTLPVSILCMREGKTNKQKTKCLYFLNSVQLCSVFCRFCLRAVIMGGGEMSFIMELSANWLWELGVQVGCSGIQAIHANRSQLGGYTIQRFGWKQKGGDRQMENLTQVFSGCGTESDPDLVFVKVTSVWTLMCHFIWLHPWGGGEQISRITKTLTSSHTG